MNYKSINPSTGELFAEYSTVTQPEIEQILVKADNAYKQWRKTSFSIRVNLIRNVGKLLIENIEEYARLISSEMGKPVAESKTEIQKCAMACEYYATEYEHMLGNIMIPTSASRSYVRFDSLGCVLGIMPWNFPFWQVIRFSIPAILAGNVVILKHAPNVPQSARALEKLFTIAEFPTGVFQNIFLGNEDVETVISARIVSSLSFTGSEKAGSFLASLAGKHLKKSVLELGGSDPFIVLPEVSLDRAVKTAVKSRMINAGQSCISAKRFIIHKDVYERFSEAFVAEMGKLKHGDPFDPSTDFGPLARKDLVEKLALQVKESLRKGAKVLTGGNRIDGIGNFYEATVLTDASIDSPAFNQELFGPVAPLWKVDSVEEAIKMANDTIYGLGSSIWTEDIELAETISSEINSGSVFINALMKSDPRMPFGGVKNSGYGRELSEFGIREFTNIKSVWIS